MSPVDLWLLSAVALLAVLGIACWGSSRALRSHGQLPGLSLMERGDVVVRDGPWLGALAVAREGCGGWLLYFAGTNLATCNCGACSS